MMSWRLRSCAVVAATSVCGLSCTWLAQSDSFAWMRPQLIADCCACLATNQAPSFAATCEQAQQQGGTVVEQDPGEPPVSCLCMPGSAQEQEDACVQALSTPPPADRTDTSGDEVLISASCVDELDGPCNTACSGVLSFAPLPEA
jgi:hypothetical protein